jgi:hypothetical protein
MVAGAGCRAGSDTLVVLATSKHATTVTVLPAGQGDSLQVKRPVGNTTFPSVNWHRLASTVRLVGG